jgi:hypothetical protein
MISEHLTDSETVDLILGAPMEEAARAHAAACVTCARQVADAREGLRLAGGAAREDPGEIFWRSLRPAIVARVRADLAARRRRARGLWTVAAAASILLGVLVWSRVGPPAAPRPSAVPAWVALPPSDEDAGWTVIEEVVPALDEEGWELDGPALADLSPAEREALVEALRTELLGGRES